MADGHRRRCLPVVLHNEERYDDISVTEVVDLPGRPHFPSVPRGDEVADYAFNWAAEGGVPALV